MSQDAAELVYVKTFWDRPPIADEGDKEQRTIYEAVGEALSNWEEVDQELADLFLIFTCEAGTRDGPGRLVRNAVRRAYGSIISNVGRRLAIEAAAEVYFVPWWGNKAVSAPLIKLLEAVGWASKRRDDIAHGIVDRPSTMEVYDAYGVLQTSQQHGSFLMPPEYKTDRTYAYPKNLDHPAGMRRARYAYNSAQIRDFTWRFQALKSAIQK